MKADVRETQAIEIDGGRRLAAVPRLEETAAPVALFDAGAFGIYADGTHVAAALEKRGWRTILYTRAGLYGSDPVPGGKTPEPFFHAADMGRLLDALDVPGPVWLFGHSMAGLRLRAFATMFPERVAGLVFIDAVTPSQLGMTIRRKLVRAECRMINACSRAAGSAIGKRALALYPNSIRLLGRAGSAKRASLTSPDHLRATQAEMLASTERSLKTKFAPLPDVPALAVTATLVARGTRGEDGVRVRHLPKTGHAEILAPKPAGMIGSWADALRGGRDLAETVGG